MKIKNAFGIFTIASTLIGLLVLIYMFTPTLNLWHRDLAVISTILFGSVTFLKLYYKVEKLPIKLPLLGTIFSLIWLLVIPYITSTSFLFHKQYKELIGEFKQGGSFAQHVAPISNDNIRIVDQAMARKLGDKIIGSDTTLGSQVYMGEFSIQQVKGELFWVAPLQHSGFFKWLDNLEGTPAYVMVSAKNERDVRLVKTYGTSDTPVRIKYQFGSYLFENLRRHVYFHGYMTTGLIDFSFEINDEGKPYWVISLYKKEIGFNGRDVYGVITVDTETGDIVEYSIADAPKWIDRIQPSSLIRNQLNDYGEYIDGWYNPSNRGKFKTTSGISLIYGNDNRSYWYTGITSYGNDESTIGFVLVDTRTKETTFYKQTGATEDAARMSAEGKVQEKGYMASHPITYNISGVPTYIMSLKDNGGLVKMIAMVSVQDYTIVGVGSNSTDALRSYKNALNKTGQSIRPDENISHKVIQSLVHRIGMDTKSGNTLYYLHLDELPSKIFVGGTQQSPELPLTLPGDSVIIRYDDTNNRIQDIIEFDNTGI